VVKKFNRLTARTVAIRTKAGRHGDGGNLYLNISKTGAKSWTFMFERGGRQREAGLGSVSAVPLAKAREIAASFRATLARGLDPIEARNAERRAQDGRKTFGQVADSFLKAKESGWRNARHRDQWRMTLTKIAAPLRDMPVADVATEHILEVLTPIWQLIPETASRLRARIEAVIDAARAAGHVGRNEANPARWKGHLEKLLPKAKKLSRGHHVAMAYAEVPAFMKRLSGQNSIAVMALQFLILTAARTGEVLGAHWAEIDLAAKVWTVPASRMKAGREHRVPLSKPAMEILEKLSEPRLGDFVFPGLKRGKPLSNMALAMLLRRMQVDVTPHGFRSAFRDWVGDETHFPRELAEAALAHTVGDKAEQAYRRSDALEKRRALMEAWSSFCAAEAPGNVVSMTRKG
jgi:integrase